MPSLSTLTCNTTQDLSLRSEYVHVIGASTLTCNTTQDLSLRSEYVHVIGAERFETNFNNFPQINYWISVSLPLNRI